MTTQEFSNEFDVLYNNIMSNQAPGLDEYEKSVFLTQAQEDIVRSYFDPKNNKVQEGFDGSQKRQYDFSSLIKTAELRLCTELLMPGYLDFPDSFVLPQLFDSKSLPYISPNNLFLVINESIIDTSTKERFLVVPITYDEYVRLKTKPYGMPLKRQAWRLITNDAGKLSVMGSYLSIGNNRTFLYITSISDKPLTINIKTSNNATPPNINAMEDKVIITLSPKAGEMVTYWRQYLTSTAINGTELSKYILPVDPDIGGIWPSQDLPDRNVTINITGTINSNNQIFEVIGKFNNFKNLIYKIRYIEELTPIILTDFGDDELTIKGYNKAMTSKLPSSCHVEILKRAVELAKAAYTGGLQETLVVGNQSSTDIGYNQRG